MLTWEFPKIGDPNIAPSIVGSLLEGVGPQNNVPYFRKLSYVVKTLLKALITLLTKSPEPPSMLEGPGLRA